MMREPVHAAANEAAMRHLASRLHQAELELAVAVGNLAWKNSQIDDLRAELEAATKPKPKAARPKHGRSQPAARVARHATS